VPTQSNEPLLQGIGVALVTLFDDSGRLLAEETAELAARLVERGVKAVLLAGSTGEPWALNAEERIELCEAARSTLGPEIPILLGTGSFSDWEATEELTRACAEAPCNAFLIMPPPGIPGDPEHYDRLQTVVGSKPVWAYHIPMLSSPGVPTGVTPKLNVGGIKDSSGDGDRLAFELATGNGRALYTGSPTLLSLCNALGVTGAILGLANTVPELCTAAFEGDLEAQAKVAPLHLDSLPDYPAHFKQTVAEVWGTSAAARPHPGPAVSYGPTAQ
jgi:4-hydroxy-tetrahydrodipicolinate synthase